MTSFLRTCLCVLLVAWFCFPRTILANDTSSLSEGEGNQHAILTNSWETVGGGRINRKYLNGLVAFCFDEELDFPTGAIYPYVTASDAAITGQIAAIAQYFGDSGIDNPQWWSQCQVAIWAVRAGCTTSESATAFARSYCADRRITDPDTVADYVYIVGALVEETSSRSGTAYLYQAEDPVNQRILTFTAIWPDPAPTYPSPQYEKIQASASKTLQRTLTIEIQNKYAAITGESLSQAVFEIYQGQNLLGTITTDSQGTASFSWTISETATATTTGEYCSNYALLDPDTREDLIGYTDPDDAYQAAYALALDQATTQAELAIATPLPITVKEVSVPFGFSLLGSGIHTITLTDQDRASLSIENMPWQASFQLEKVDGITSQAISAPATFTLYEWDGTEYQISPHYKILRLEDGTYTVSSGYPEGELGLLYYTQQNQGRFALQETQAPSGYYPDEEWVYFTISQNGEVIFGHNTSWQDYPIADDTRFANLPHPQPQFDAVSVTVEQTATRRHEVVLDKKTASITEEPIAHVRFQVYEKGEPVGIITTDEQGRGRCQWELSETASATVLLEYCSNYEELEPEEQAMVTGYLSKAEAWEAATLQATAQASAMAQQLADQPQEVTIQEISTPIGFLPTQGTLPTVVLAGNDSATFSVTNTPWQAIFSLKKVDGTTGEPIAAIATFILYEWDGTDYQVSPHYEIIRLDDGTYTISSRYLDGQDGLLYYTQTNEGLFALAEVQAPQGYLQDPQWTFFEITGPDQILQGHNADPSAFPFGNNTVFANMPSPPPAPVLDDPPAELSSYSAPGAATGDSEHPWFWLLCILGSGAFFLKIITKRPFVV